jgi:hypothetical protein
MRIIKSIWLYLSFIPVVVAGTVVPWITRADDPDTGGSGTQKIAIVQPSANQEISGVMTIAIYAPYATWIKARLVMSTIGTYYPIQNPMPSDAKGVWSTSFITTNVPDGYYLLSVQAAFPGTSNLGSATVPITIANAPHLPTYAPTPQPLTTTQTLTPAPTSTTKETETPAVKATAAPIHTAVPLDTEAVNEEVAKLEQRAQDTAHPVITDPAAVEERIKKLSSDINFSIVNIDLQAGATASPTPSSDTVSSPSPSVSPTTTPTSNKIISISVHVGIPNIPVTLTIHSDILTISGETNSAGDYVYYLDSPLEPGKHTATISVIDPQTNKKVEKSSSFFISTAVAASNLNGRSLTLEDPSVALMRRYLMATAGVIFLCLVFMLWAFSRRSRELSKDEETNGTVS